MFSYEILRSARRDRKLIGYHIGRPNREGHDELNQSGQFRRRTATNKFSFKLTAR